MSASRFTAEQKRDCARREVKQRERVYARRVETRSMSTKEAEFQIACMREIADEYEQLAAKERLI